MRETEANGDKAAEDGVTAALVTRDEDLSKQVKSALLRWNIVPDDARAKPLGSSSEGIFLRLVADLLGAEVSALALIDLLKHPVTGSGGSVDIHHVCTHELEVSFRMEGRPDIDVDTVPRWAVEKEEEISEVDAWAEWVAQFLESAQSATDGELSDIIAHHRRLAEFIGSGFDGYEGGDLWRTGVGSTARELFKELEAASAAAGQVDLDEYAMMFRALFAMRSYHLDDFTHGNIKIWDTLDARMQKPDLIIAGRMNEGNWPRHAGRDPWLNRSLRKRAGLPVPERRVGLTAHDFQHVICVPEIVITRCARDPESPTVPSRWLNRLSSLLRGIGPQGARALGDMRARGQDILDQARQLEHGPKRRRDVFRPSPRPPVETRPSKLSVTQVQTLIDDPYAIYASEILRLLPLKPLCPPPDQRLRGIVYHRIFERVIRESAEIIEDYDEMEVLLADIAEEVFENFQLSPGTHRSWLCELMAGTRKFLDQENSRRIRGTPSLLEKTGKVNLLDNSFTLSGRADRLDFSPSGVALLYDYKTAKKVDKRNRQLPLLARMVELGGFPEVGACEITRAAVIQLGSKPSEVEFNRSISSRDRTGDLFAETWKQLKVLILNYRKYQTGYTPKRTSLQYAGEYDHLSRLGEWDVTTSPTPINLR